MTEVNVSKYKAQIKYDKQRKETDPEYKQKKNKQVRQRNNQRYNTDPVYREAQKTKARERSALLRQFYKDNKNNISDPQPDK